MMYFHSKYREVEDFICNNPPKVKSEPYTILDKCKGFNGKTNSFCDDCFACLFCVVNNDWMIRALIEHRGNDFIKDCAENSFFGNLITPIKALKKLKPSYSSLEQFTSTHETTNIQPWGTGLLAGMGLCTSRVSMEIPAHNTKYSRDGRIDIGVVSNGISLFVETKIDLVSTLSDERFIEQHVKYTTEIEKYTDKYLYLTMIGGAESDLLPPSHPNCTGKLGDMSKRFYDIAVDNHINFISAEALWCLCCKYITFGKKYCWDSVLCDVFGDNKTIGLLSCGKICVSNDGYFIGNL